MRKKIDYRSAGVNIEKADRLVAWIKGRASFSKCSLGSDYASLFPLNLKKYKNPIIASSTDGIGTKVKLANYFSHWSGLGQDLVAMCVNDLICVGAEPLFFLDYYACGKLNFNQSKKFLEGVYQACEEASCELIGGETAELPGLYKQGDIDCAGFAVGVVEKDQILGPQRVRAGDDVIALPSSGFHSNGYSLLRQIYRTPRDLKKYRKILMRPTRLYTFLQPYWNELSGLRAAAHITGGGLDNILRILPPHLSLNIQPWSVPFQFLDVKNRARLSWNSLLKTFNSGLGFVIIIKNKQEFFEKNIWPREQIIELGKVEKSSQKKSSWSINQKAMDEKNHV